MYLETTFSQDICRKATSPQQTDGSFVFTRWCQCALPWGKSISSAIFAQITAECRQAHWRQLANTIELVLPSAHPSPQPKWQIDRLSHFCTAHGRKSLYFRVDAPFRQNCPFPCGDL